MHENPQRLCHLFIYQNTNVLEINPFFFSFVTSVPCAIANSLETSVPIIETTRAQVPNIYKAITQNGMW